MPRIDFKKINEKVSPITILFVALSILTIFVFLFFLILPDHKSIKKIQQDIKSASADIQVINEKFLPVYAKAKKFEVIKFEPRFPIPNRKNMDRKNLSTLPDLFQKLALEHNLKLSNKDLDPDFLNTEAKKIPMFLELDGNLQNFRNYLIAIIALPFFDSFEKININSMDNTIKKFSVDLKINIK